MQNDTVTFVIDQKEVRARRGQTILEAAEQAGVYIPRLCHLKGLTPHGSCRVCTVRVNGRYQAACTYPVADDLVVENDTEELRTLRRDLLEMLLVEGNHFCMFCEKSGHCELQALAYRHSIAAPKYPHLWPRREVDASHPDVLLDRNRCVLCGRCVRVSRDVDGKNVFGFVGRGPHRHLGVNSRRGLGGSDLSADDQAVTVCPVGCLLRKRTAFQVPVGQRRFDRQPIGAEVGAGAGSPQPSESPMQ
ncbi:MAG: 2Fe-2S iron-sulfur cluster binding domain-containing protein [Planctomycetes bacterium]|nr:2Fe-2S iron-sulfur cluster binding domain-containing protein [Planctomycetota bacterium]